MSAPPTIHPFGATRLTYGADYNPEQWSPATWARDLDLMVEAGVTMVAVNIFGWARVEPRPGEFRFDELDAVLDGLGSHGIAVNLGTGTASPPPWLAARHPETLPQTIDGVRLHPGGRQAWCPSSPVFRERSLELVRRTAERYGAHPAVALWHVSNELGCHNALCYCDVSAEGFRRWLRERYGTVDELNRVWGTSFWSQGYGDWDEVSPPRRTPATANPTQQLDFRRFSSDELLGQYLAERDVIRESGRVPVTTNFMVAAHIHTQDYWRWAPEVDVVANDHYLDHRLPDPFGELAFTADLTRGLAEGEPWFLMESATGAVNWQPRNIAKLPGELLRDSLSYVARGADAVSFFQWRASRFGSEKFHSAMLGHAGTDSPQWAEVVELGRVLGDLADVVGTRVEADVALVFDWQAGWACDLDSHPSDRIRYLDEVHAMHAALRATGHGVDVVRPGADLAGYRVVVVPTLYSCTDQAAATIADYVAGGGHAVVTYFSGIVDEADHIRPGAFPGAFRDLLGVRTFAFHPLSDDETVSLSNGAHGTRWIEHLEVVGARVIASALDGPLPGVPVLTRHEVGDGTAWYVATTLDEADRRSLIGRIVEEADPDAGSGPPATGSGVDLIRRVGGDGRRFAFAINTTDAVATVRLTGDEIVTGEPVDGPMAIPPRGVRVVRERGPRREGATR